MKALLISILLGILFLYTDQQSVASAFNPPDSTDVSLTLIRKDNPDEPYKYEIGQQISIQMDRGVEIEGVLTAVKGDSIRIYSQWFGIDQIRSISPPVGLLDKRKEIGKKIALSGLGIVTVTFLVLSVLFVILLLIIAMIELMNMLLQTEIEWGIPPIFLWLGSGLLVSFFATIVAPLFFLGRGRIRLGKKWSLITKKVG